MPEKNINENILNYPSKPLKKNKIVNKKNKSYKIDSKCLVWLINIMHDEEERNSHEDDIKYSKKIYDLILYLLYLLKENKNVE